MKDPFTQFILLVGAGVALWFVTKKLNATATAPAAPAINVTVPPATTPPVTPAPNLDPTNATLAAILAQLQALNHPATTTATH